MLDCSETVPLIKSLMFSTQHVAGFLNSSPDSSPSCSTGWSVNPQMNASELRERRNKHLQERDALLCNFSQTKAKESWPGA